MVVLKSTVTSEYDAKSICEYCCKKFRCPKLSSAKSSQVWNARNDSSNVSSLLAPDFDDKSVSATTNRTLVSKTVTKRCINSAILSARSSDSPAHCEKCYCRESPNLPLLDLRPVPQGEVKRKKSALRRNIGEFARERRGHGVKRIVKDAAAKNDSKCYLSKSSLSYTDTRHDYEVKSRDYEAKSGDYEGKSGDYEGKSGDYGAKSGDYETKSQSYEAKSGDYKGKSGDYEAKAGDFWKIDEPGSKIAPPGHREEESDLKINEKTMSYKDFKELSKFRKEQYFDCHRMGDSVSYAVPDHKCVHKFILNDRLLPEPINCDTFGFSRCDICNKPMKLCEGEKKDWGGARKPVNNVKRIYEYNLKPPRLNIGCGNETVQIKVPDRIGKEFLFQKTGFKISRNVPENSFALRYQRGFV